MYIVHKCRIAPIISWQNLVSERAETIFNDEKNNREFHFLFVPPGIAENTCKFPSFWTQKMKWQFAKSERDEMRTMVWICALLYLNSIDIASVMHWSCLHFCASMANIILIKADTCASAIIIGMWERRTNTRWTRGINKIFVILYLLHLTRTVGRARSHWPPKCNCPCRSRRCHRRSLKCHDCCTRCERVCVSRRCFSLFCSFNELIMLTAGTLWDRVLSWLAHTLSINRAHGKRWDNINSDHNNQNQKQEQTI